APVEEPRLSENGAREELAAGELVVPGGDVPAIDEKALRFEAHRGHSPLPCVPDKLRAWDRLFRILNNGLERRRRLLLCPRARRLYCRGQGAGAPQVEHQRVRLAAGRRAWRALAAAHDAARTSHRSRRGALTG